MTTPKVPQKRNKVVRNGYNEKSPHRLGEGGFSITISIPGLFCPATVFMDFNACLQVPAYRVPLLCDLFPLEYRPARSYRICPERR